MNQPRQHVRHLIGNLNVAVRLVGRGVAIHIVNVNADLLHVRQNDEVRVLADLALNPTSLEVALGNGHGEIPARWHHDERHVCLRSPP